MSNVIDGSTYEPDPDDPLTEPELTTPTLMTIVNTYEEGDYTINEYSNGVIEKYLTAFPPMHEIPTMPLLDEREELQLSMAVNIEMLLAMAELSMV